VSGTDDKHVSDTDDKMTLDPAVPVSDLLERLEAQVATLTTARVRGRQLERLLRTQVERREALEAELEGERAHNARLASELDALSGEAQAREAAEAQVYALQATVQVLEQECAGTRMQLEALRGELASKRSLLKRLRPRSWR
jgi:predicted RNase H-like nuclease (RuvC/YqgF family)